jgi:hypothetical protein
MAETCTHERSKYCSCKTVNSRMFLPNSKAFIWIRLGKKTCTEYTDDDSEDDNENSSITNWTYGNTQFRAVRMAIVSTIRIIVWCMCLPSKCHYGFYTSEPLNFPSVTLRMLAWNLLKTMYMVSNCYNILIYVSFVCCIVLRLAVELFVLLLQRRRSGPDSVGGVSFRSRHQSEGEGAYL